MTGPDDKRGDTGPREIRAMTNAPAVLAANGARDFGGIVLPDRVPPIVPAVAWLEQIIESVIEPHPDVPTVQTLPEGARLHVRALLGKLLPLAGPAPRPVLLAWLWPIADAVEYPPAEDEFFRRLAALELVAADIPCVAWTKESQREALRIWKRFPSVAAIVQLVVGAEVQALTKRIDALKYLTFAGTQNLRLVESKGPGT